MSYLENYKRWLNEPSLCEEEKTALIQMSDDEIKESFTRFLEFGTAGLRGIMGLGIGRMNVHVIRLTTQCFAEVILEDSPELPVAVCFDCRNNSRLFAEEVSRVLAANGLNVLLFKEMRPTPELSFAVRHYHCIAGINITASHNTKEYNGYKAYWSDGSQLSPDRAIKIAEKIYTNDIFNSPKLISLEEGFTNGKIRYLTAETDQSFLRCVKAESTFLGRRQGADDFKMVYTPFHGTGGFLVPGLLREVGVHNLYCVPEQMITDGGFPTVTSPNPEYAEGFALSIQLADREGADFILGTDPDSDRVGIMIRNRYGDFISLTGNLAGMMLLDYLIDYKKKNDEMPKNPVILKSIVSTEMASRIATENGIECIDTFTGFKYLGEKKTQLESETDKKVIFAFEEAYGYMVGDFVRDKDAVTASMLFAEMAMHYHIMKKPLWKVIDELYERYGVYKEKTVSVVFEGLQGADTIANIMKKLRENLIDNICSSRVNFVLDYSTGLKLYDDGHSEFCEPSGANVIRFALCDGSAIVVRPSGTEPKIRIYILCKSDSVSEGEERIAKYSKWAQNIANIL